MKWEKKGLIYCADGEVDWMHSHAMIPTPILIDEKLLRVYCSFCDQRGIGRVGFVDIDPFNLKRIINISKEPIVDIGLPGTFDENGCLVCSVVLYKNKLYLYYAGFELGKKIRYRLLTGLAISNNNYSEFIRYQETPILERTNNELYFRCGPFVRFEENKFKLWYVGGSEWELIDGKMMPVYRIKYAESEDGIHWPEESVLCIDIENEHEHGFGRPYVIKDNNMYKMFYSIRVKHKGYRLGYAESLDGIHWERKDNEIGIDVSEKGWDSEMICYSAVITIHGKTYMFYNGNEFGKTGFGYAELISWD
jgi:sucrose-6-phosphate hydrolase SacC (GH32 family)